MTVCLDENKVNENKNKGRLRKSIDIFKNENAKIKILKNDNKWSSVLNDLQDEFKTLFNEEINNFSLNSK